MSAAAASEVKADGRYLVGVSPLIILSTVRDIFGGLSNANSIERYNYENALGAIRQGGMPTHMYQTAYKRNVKLCKAARSAITESDYIGKYVTGLNVSIFEDCMNDFVRDPNSVPATLGEVMAEVLVEEKQKCGVNPTLGKFLDHSIKGFAALRTPRQVPLLLALLRANYVISLVTMPNHASNWRTIHLWRSCALGSYRIRNMRLAARRNLRFWPLRT
jgi:hypothetical protein